MINDDDVSKALEYLATSAEAYGQAVRLEASLGELAKNFKAELMMQSDAGSQSAKETHAMTHPEYREITEDKLPGAKRAVAYHKARQKWAETVVSVWQTRARMQREAEKVR